jgi:hypothetical protein
VPQTLVDLDGSKKGTEMKKTSQKGPSKVVPAKVVTKSTEVLKKPEVSLRRAIQDKLVAVNDADRALGHERISSIALLNKSMQAQFKEQAKAFQLVLEDMPDFSSTDVIRLCIHLALQKEDFESAARWAKELVEFERPKLSRKEVIERDDSHELTDQELQDELRKEGVVLDFVKAAKKKAAKRG